MSAPEPPAGEIRKTIVVRCDLETAFYTWTEQIDAWWPKAHSRSGNPATSVFIERQVGGRVYERTPEGVEHDWGRVLAWDPPRHLAYYWFLGSSPQQPSRVDVHFTPHELEGTRVEVLHRGPALIGELWPSRSTIFDAAWQAVLAAFGAALDTEEENNEGV